MKGYKIDISPNFHEDSRYNLAIQLISFYLSIIFIMTIFSIFYEKIYFWYYLSTTLLLATALIFIKKIPSSYKIFVNLLILLVYFLIYLSIIFVKEDIHYIESFWMMVCILTAFYILGSKWGYFYIVLNAILYFLYFNFFYLSLEEFMVASSNYSLLINSIELVVSTALIGYIMYNYHLLNKITIANHIDVIQKLENEKILLNERNNEKTNLLQEIHHRVKNNLQIIISLLRMQANNAEDEEAKTNFHEAINRIMTMSLIHQKMYESRSLKDINLKEYIEKLIKDIIESLNKSDRKVDYVLEINLQKLDIERIIPLGLIINELLSTTIKKSNQESFIFRLELTRKNQDGMFNLIYFDDSLRSEVDTEFGQQLIQIFTEQLDGDYTFENKGNKTYFYFNLYDKGTNTMP